MHKGHDGPPGGRAHLRKAELTMEKTLLAVDGPWYGGIERLKAQNGREYTVANFLAVDECFCVDRRNECVRA